jgi:DNA-binding XRE family transcriptional regulator
VHTLHLLPGQVPGDEADIVLSPRALTSLIELLKKAQEDGYSACAEFNQRDGRTFQLCVQVIDREHSHPDWRHVPLAYMRHNARHILRNHKDQDYDADLLSASVKVARRVRGHTQQQAAAAMGLSLATVSNLENRRHVPRPENWPRILEYTSSEMWEYELE